MLISFVLALAVRVLRVFNLILFVYCIMSFVAPDNTLYRMASEYIELVLNPFRRKMYGWIPAMRNLPVDVSPLFLWAVIQVAMTVLRILERVF